MGARADLLLLDEPTRGLDPSVKRALSAYLRTRAGAGASILVATHDVEWAARSADRVLLMADGEIYADGPPGADNRRGLRSYVQPALVRISLFAELRQAVL